MAREWKPATPLPAKEKGAAETGKAPDESRVAGDNDWEELLPLGSLAPLPPFPVSTLPGYLAAMVTAVATEIQVPADLPGALAMGVLSTAAGGRAEVVVRGQWREPLNLYLATAMPPGSGKSPAFRLMCAPIFEAERDMRAAAAQERMEAERTHADTITAAENALAKARGGKDKDRAKGAEEALKLAQAAPLAVPVLPRLTADDVVPEQAATIMADQGGRLAILSAEGTFLSVLMGRYSNGTPNIELALKGHAGDRVQVDRRGREELIERPALTICTTVQPKVLREVAAKAAVTERGLLARFLINLPPDLVGHRLMTPELVHDDVRRDYHETILNLIEALAGWADPGVLALTPAALKLHTEFREGIEPRLRRGAEFEPLRDWASKLPGATARIAGLLHLAENPGLGPRGVIDEDIMSRAITQAQYWADHAMAAYGALRAHPALDAAKSVLEWIGDSESFKQRDVHRAMQRQFATVADLALPLRVLEEHGYIRRADTSGSAGRPKVLYDVHPGHTEAVRGATAPRAVTQ